MKLITSPEEKTQENTTLFLAGSIEMDTAIDWQHAVVDALKNIDVTILNPRRNEWDSTWAQVRENSVFNEQVNWELDGIIDVADIVCFYFDPATKSPVTLLELGITLASKKRVVVFCPDGYWRKGNVDITCQRYDVEVLTDFEMFIDTIKKKIIEVS